MLIIDSVQILRLHPGNRRTSGSALSYILPSLERLKQRQMFPLPKMSLPSTPPCLFASALAYSMYTNTLSLPKNERFNTCNSGLLSTWSQIYSPSLRRFTLFPLDSHNYTVYIHRHIYQSFYNTVCLMHKHTAGRVAQSKHSAYRHTHTGQSLS